MDQEHNQRYATDSYDRVGAERLLGLLSTGVLLMQGPMGSMLSSELGAQDIPAAYWNVAEPQEVTRIHQQYADAGAQVLGIGRDCQHGLGRGSEQQIVDHRFVLIGDSSDTGRQGEDQVYPVAVRKTIQLCRYPQVCGLLSAGRAGTAAT